MIRLQGRVEGVVRLGLLDDVTLEEVEVLGQVLVRETRADLANRLVLFVFRIVDAKQETAVAAGALALAQVPAHDDHIEGVADAIL